MCPQAWVPSTRGHSQAGEAGLPRGNLQSPVGPLNPQAPPLGPHEVAVTHTARGVFGAGRRHQPDSITGTAEGCPLQGPANAPVPADAGGAVGREC